MNERTAKSEEAKRKQERQALREKNDWQWLLADERGQRIVRDLIARTGVMRQTFQPNAMTVAFAEGQRNEGLFILDRVGRYAPSVLPVLFSMRDDDDE